MDGAYDILPDGIHAARTRRGMRRQSGFHPSARGPVTCRRSDRPGRTAGHQAAAAERSRDRSGVGSWPASRRRGHPRRRRRHWKLARTAAVRAPILPVKGYAATVPVTDRGGAPRVGGVLENRHVAFSRMGDRLRLSTGAEIGRTDHDVTEPMMRLLKQAGEDLCPGALDWPSARYRAEHRPMTPCGLPMIGPTRIPACTSTRHTARWAGPRQPAQPTY